MSVEAALNVRAMSGGAPVGPTNTQILGDVLWLLGHSPLHRKWRLIEVERWILPALHHKRYRLFRSEGRPVAYVSLARLSPEVEARWLAGGYWLKPDDWVSGEILWYIDFVAPFGNSLEVRKWLWNDPELIGKPQKAIRPNKGGKGRKVVQFGKYRHRKKKPWTTRIINAFEDEEMPAAPDGSPPSEQPGRR